MDETNWEGFKKTYRKEKDPGVRARMLAVRMVHVRKRSVEDTADLLMQSPDWVRYWIRRYDRGLDGLRDLPRCGRPRSIPASTLNRIIFELGSSRITPVMLQQVIHAKAVELDN